MINIGYCNKESKTVTITECKECWERNSHGQLSNGIKTRCLCKRESVNKKEVDISK